MWNSDSWGEGRIGCELWPSGKARAVEWSWRPARLPSTRARRGLSQGQAPDARWMTSRRGFAPAAWGRWGTRASPSTPPGLHQRGDDGASVPCDGHHGAERRAALTGDGFPNGRDHSLSALSRCWLFHTVATAPYQLGRGGIGGGGKRGQHAPMCLDHTLVQSLPASPSP
jgi:hypothetical protein